MKSQNETGPAVPPGMHVLAIDIGGTHVKVLATGQDTKAPVRIRA